MTLRVATDIGGTFTDLVYVRDGQLSKIKCDTTHPYFEQGVLNAIAKAHIDSADIDFFAHGTTVVINALTERKGVKTGLITTRGFRDVLEIARGDTPDIFNVYYTKPKPFVPRYLRQELTERLDKNGNVVKNIELRELDEIVALFKQESVEAVAICFLHAYANSDHEKRAVQYVKELWPEVAIIASHDVCRELREYERTNTTVLSAYILPPTQEYLNRLEGKLSDGGLRSSPFIMQSNGGVATAAAARANPISLVESGPVGGMLGAASYGRLIGEKNLIALDIGGTTAKCSMINDGNTRITTEYVIEKTSVSSGYPIRTPVIDIVEIGNGGGSIAWIDGAKALHVGPKSAGSTPGPVAYGRGGSEPTTTDANLFTGRINSENYAGGEVSPDMRAVETAFLGLGEQLEVSAMDVALGVIQIANANMVNALKLVSVNRGNDPRDCALMAFGGGGAMHATALAAELNMPKVIIPPNAGVFSAWGMLMLDLRRDYVRTQMQPLNIGEVKKLEQAYQNLQIEADNDFREDGFEGDDVVHERFLDARYVGQDHTVKIRLNAGSITSDLLVEIIENFHREHEKEFTFRLESQVEVVNVHLVSFGMVEKSVPQLLSRSTSSSAEIAITGQRQVNFDKYGIHLTTIYDREKLLPGMLLNGPAIIEEETTTTVVLPFNHVELDGFGGLHIHFRNGGEKL